MTTPDSNEGPTHLAFAAMLFALTVLAGCFRFYKLGDPSLWSDELFTLRDAIAGLQPGYVETRIGLLFSGLEIGTLAPEGYATWRGAGLSEWSARLGAATVGTLTVPALTLASLAFLGPRAALAFALLLAVNTWHIEWSQSARFYSPMFLYYNGALALYLSHRFKPAPWKLVLAMLGVALAVGTKPTSLMIFGVIGIDLLYGLIRNRRLELKASEFAILFFGVLLCGGAYAYARSNAFVPAEALRPFVERDANVSALRLVASNVIYAGSALCCVAAAGFLLWARKQERMVAFLGAATAVPLIAFGTLSFFFHVETRYTFMNLYGWVALAALGGTWAFGRLEGRGATVFAALPLTLVLVTTLYANLVYSVSAYGNRPRWRHAFEYVREARKPGETVFTTARWSGRFYLEDESVRSPRVDFEGIESLQVPAWFVVRSTRYELGEGRPHWLDGLAELRSVYPTRTPYPQETIRVYFYRPGSAKLARASSTKGVRQ